MAGVPISSVEDMKTLFADIPLDKVAHPSILLSSLLHHVPLSILFPLLFSVVVSSGLRVHDHERRCSAGPGLLHRGRRRAGRLAEPTDRHHTERYFERIYGAEYLHLPAQGVSPHHPGHLLLHQRVHAQIQQHQHQRVKTKVDQFYACFIHLSPFISTIIHFLIQP